MYPPQTLKNKPLYRIQHPNRYFATFILIYLVIYLKQLQFFGLDQGAMAINCVCMSQTVLW